MQIISVSVRGVRQFADRTAHITGFSAGLCVWAAPNERGKSTVVDALVAVFLRDRKSTAADIRALVPHSGGSPEITVNFLHKGVVWTLFKRYLRNPSAEVRDAAGALVAQGDAAEAWLSQEFPHAALAVDLLWARQGALAMEPEGSGPVEKRQREEGRESRRGLLSAASAALDAGLGGPRFDAVRARLASELAELRTPTGRARTGGSLDKAQKRFQCAQKALAEAAAMKDRADAAVATRAHARVAQAEAEARFSQAMKDAEVAQHDSTRLAQEVDAARCSFAPLSGAISALEDASAKRETALSNHHRRVQAQQAHECARADIAKLQREQEGLDLRLNKAEADLCSAQESFNIADRQMERAKQALLSAQAGALNRRIREYRDVPTPSATLQACAQWEAEIARFDALNEVHEGILAEAVWEGIEPPAGWVAGEAHVLRDGDVLVVGRGRFVVRSPGGTERLEQRERLHLRLLEHQKETGFVTPADLRAALEKAREAAIQISVLEQERVSRFADVVPSDVSPEKALAVLEDARYGADQAREHLAALHQAVAVIRRERDTMERRMLSVQGALNTAGAVLDALPESVGDLGAIEATYTAAQDKAAQARAAYRLVEDREAALAEAQMRLNAALQVVEDVRPVRDAARERRADADGVARMVAEGDPDTVFRAAQHEFEIVQSDLSRWEQEAEALGLAIQALDNARAARKMDLFEPARLQMEPLVQAVFGQATARFGTDSLLPNGLARGGVSEDASVLSGGTRDLLHILGRLAFAQVLKARGIDWPVLLDDSFAQIDEDRIKALGALLEGQSSYQIVALSGRITTLKEWTSTHIEHTVLV